MKVTKEMLVRDGRAWANDLQRDGKRYRELIRERAEEIIQMSAGETITSLDEVVNLAQNIIKLAAEGMIAEVKANTMTITLNEVENM